MKKILIFSLAYYPRFVSGAEAAIKEITDRTDPQDIEFHMVTLRFDPTDPRAEIIGNVHVHRVGIGPSYLSKILFIPLAVTKGIMLCRKEKISGLWAMLTYMALPIALMRLFGVRIPYVITLQDGDPYEKVFGRKFIKPLLPLLDYGFRHATVVQAISTFLATWPKRRGFTVPVEIVYNGANPKDIADKTPQADIDAMKQKLGKKEDEVYLVNTARLEHQKAQDDVIRALPLLPKNVKFLIVGGGTDETMLKDLVKELHLGSRVIFTGQVDRTEVTLYRKVSDIFVAPSRSEGLGNAFLSAMASRLPVVATQEGGLAEFIFDEKHNPGIPPTAWVVDADNSAQIAEAVKDIMNSKAKVREITERAREMVLQKYNWDAIAKDMQVKIFSKVLKD